MKIKTTTSLVAIFAFSFSAIAIAVASSESNENKPVSVLVKKAIQEAAAQEEVTPPIPAADIIQEPTPVIDETTLTAPSVVDVVSPEPMMVVPQMVAPQMVAAPAGSGCCDVCCRRRCRCCPPPPVPTTFCLVDPCGCTHEACVDVPACCAGEEPCITWRNGILKRQIATLCWTCCGHEVKVIVTGRGKVRVRD